jgi:hypothetical protein
MVRVRLRAIPATQGTPTRGEEARCNLDLASAVRDEFLARGRAALRAVLKRGDLRRDSISTSPSAPPSSIDCRHRSSDRLGSRRGHHRTRSVRLRPHHKRVPVGPEPEERTFQRSAWPSSGFSSGSQRTLTPYLLRPSWHWPNSHLSPTWPPIAHGVHCWPSQHCHDFPLSL